MYVCERQYNKPVWLETFCPYRYITYYQQTVTYALIYQVFHALMGIYKTVERSIKC